MTYTKKDDSLSSLDPTPEVFGGALDSWRRWLQACQLAEKTLHAYLLGVRRFHLFLVANSLPTRLSDIKRRHVEMWVVSMRAETTARGTPLAVGSINRYIKSLSVFLTWCVEEELIATSPAERIREARGDERPPDVLTPEEIAKLFKACAGKGFYARRDMALLRLWYATGIRRAEIAGLRLGDVDLDKRMIYIHGKRRRERNVRIGPRTVAALDRYLRMRSQHRQAEGTDAFWLGKGGPLSYVSFYTILARRSQEAGIRHVNPHLWRHTMAHRYLAAGGGETNLQSLMGWTSGHMLKRYGASMIAERARDEYDRLGLDDDL